MGKNSSKKKQEQLGIPFGTAANKLRKNLLYSMVVKTSMNTCFKCGNLIESCDELTIDHKVDWFNSENPVELFFDLDNIAFSHAKCNRPRYGNTAAGGYSKSVVLSSTGFKGVYYEPKRPEKQKYRANIVLRDYRKTVGRFPTARQAAEAYDKALIEYMGDSAVTNKSLGLL